MKILEIFFLGIALSMDAFAVSICKGLSMHKISWKKAIIIGLYFGVFQALMPLIGYFLGISFQNIVTKLDHWIAFTLLTALGINMIIESNSKSPNLDESINLKTMLLLSIATSIDALAIGITFSFLKVNIITSITIIGIITFTLSVIGVVIGNKFGTKYESKSQKLGGIILIIIGTKILLEHLKII